MSVGFQKACQFLVLPLPSMLSFLRGLKEIPRGVWFLLVAETIFRFSFFGVVGVFTSVAKDEERWSLLDTEAALAFSLFYGAVWLSCVPGGLLADWLRRPLVVMAAGGILYCLGLWFVPTPSGGWVLLPLLSAAIGFGCLRPVISTLLGDQFGRYVLTDLLLKESVIAAPEDRASLEQLAYLVGREFKTEEDFLRALDAKLAGGGLVKSARKKLVAAAYVPQPKDPLRKAFFAWSYIATNVGALCGFLFAPALIDELGLTRTAHTLGLAGLAAAGIVLASFPWLRVAPVPKEADFANGTVDRANPAWRRWVLVVTVVWVASFWLIYNRTHDRVVFQAASINHQILFTNWQLQPNQFQFLNPLFVIILTPFLRLRYFSFEPDSMLVGYVFLVLFISLTLVLQLFIVNGLTPLSDWLVATYGLATIAEIFLAIPANNYFYNITSHRRARSMGLGFAAIGLGELVGAALNGWWGKLFPNESEETVNIWIFAALAGLAVIVMSTLLLALRTARGRSFFRNGT
jgi:POT family proton-dependent oligopeptide transporter